MAKLGRTVGAVRTVLRPDLATRPAVGEHGISVTFKKVESRYLLEVNPRDWTTISGVLL